MFSLKDIYWAAGFLEGEGCFRMASKSPTITAAQVQKDPLFRLKNMFGGFLPPGSKPYTKNASVAYLWRIHGVGAISIMMTLYSLMSPKRKEQIKKTINVWKKQAIYGRDKTHCKRGHRFTEANIYRWKNGTRQCRTCQHIRGKERRQRNIKVNTKDFKSQLSFWF